MILQIDIMDKITEVGGALALVLSVGIVALWIEYKSTKKDLSELNKVVRDTGLEDIRIIERLTDTIKNGSEKEDQILKAVNETLTILKDRNHN
jgi:hypothetical protein